jgi:dihydroflavonol-4-reductase
MWIDPSHVLLCFRNHAKSFVAVAFMRSAEADAIRQNVRPGGPLQITTQTLVENPLICPYKLGKEMRALVTGATGFIGSHVAEALVARGYEVTCLVRRTSDLRWLSNVAVRLVYGSVEDKESLLPAVEDQEYVFHCAGLTKAKRARDYFRVNTGGTENLLRACEERQIGLNRFVLVSSQAAVGPSGSRTPLVEDDPCRPITPYGRSKYEAEQLVRQAGERIGYCIVRPSAVYGPRDRDILFFFQMIQRGVILAIGGREHYLNLVYVDDLVRGILAAAEAPGAAGEAYFVTYARPYQWEEAARIVARALGYAVALLAEGAGLLKRKAALLNRDKMRDIMQSYWLCSPEKIETQLGFRATVGLEEGAPITAHWYREHGWLR